jgi:amidase
VTSLVHDAPHGGTADALVRASAWQQRDALLRGELSAVELVDAILREIDRINPTVNAVVQVDAAGARQCAADLDARLRRGEDPGPLHGVPITVKDTLDVGGFATTAGTSRYAHNRPADDAPAVARLRAAGAVVVGKTNVPKLAGDYQTYNSVHGLTRNPWALERTCGGSSGGSAVSVACGFGALDIGSDTAGSLSLPAHYCGVYAHKPTYGSVPTVGHVPPAPGSRLERDITVVGPLARDPRDLVAAFEALTGTPRSTEVPLEVRRSRIAVLIDEGEVPLDADVVEVLSSAIDALRDGGFAIAERGRPAIDIRMVQAVCCELIAAAASAVMPDDKFEFIGEVAAGLPEDDLSQVALLARGTVMSHRRWLRLQEWVRGYQAEWARYFAEVDLVVCPVGPTTAFPHDIESDRESRTLSVAGITASYFAQLAWPSVVGLAHAPATTIPAGRTASGLPVGLQVVAPFGHDHLALSAACAFDEYLGGFRPPPVVQRAARAFRR